MFPGKNNIHISNTKPFKFCLEISTSFSSREKRHLKPPYCLRGNLNALPDQSTKFNYTILRVVRAKMQTLTYEKLSAK